jgi:hypothetical protein
MSDEIKKADNEDVKAEANPELSEQQLDEAVGGTKPQTKPVEYLEWKFKQVG